MFGNTDAKREDGNLKSIMVLMSGRAGESVWVSVSVCVGAYVCHCVCEFAMKVGSTSQNLKLSWPSLPESVKKAVCYIYTHIYKYI